MESELSPDKGKDVPPVPIKTYQWEDLKRCREAGAYPWTHLLKPPLEGEITAEDIIRETTPRRSMSREVSRSRTRSPVIEDVQKILMLDSSPGSSRKHGEEGEDEGVHIPNFSKEVSLDSEPDDPISQAANAYVSKGPESDTSIHLVKPIVIPKNVSPKGILKRRVPEPQYIGIYETREKTKCCHPLVNKIKHLADKTLHKLDKNENEKSPVPKRKKNEGVQEIRQLRDSPGAVRRQKFSAIKLGDSDEMSKTMSIETPPRKKKDHIYEDIEESNKNMDTSLYLSSGKIEQDERQSNSNKECDSWIENKSNASQDPSLITEDNMFLRPTEHVMEKLHKVDGTNNEAVFLDDEQDSEEPNIDEVFQNQLDETRKNDSPNITITEIIDEEVDPVMDNNSSIPIETSPSPSPRAVEKRNLELDRQWSRPSSDHEYEIIEKPPPNIVYTAPSVEEKPTMVNTEDELSSTTSLDRKCLQTSDEDEHTENRQKDNCPKDEGLASAEELQKDIEDRFFVNTPSTVSRTECEISTSQVDSSALENLPLKRDSRTKNMDSVENRIQQRIKDGTGRLKTQAGKLKTKLQNFKSKQFNSTDRPKFSMPDRPKLKIPDRPKFTMPDRRKFSLPEKPKLKSINLSEKLSFGDRKKFSFPDRPKFSVPDLPKFKMPERPKIMLQGLTKKKESKSAVSDSNSDLKNEASIDFEAKTYPRLFKKKKKSGLPKTSSSPTLNREETPPPTFTFTKMKSNKSKPIPYIPDSPEEPREYGNIDTEGSSGKHIDERKNYEIRYDFDKLASDYMDDEKSLNDFSSNRNSASIPDVMPSKLEYTHVINEINNDEFFVRPRGISRENIQVREYLSDEIRQAFNIPQNALALMGSETAVNNNTTYAMDIDADPDLMDDNEPIRYSNEFLNERDDGYYTFPPVRPSRARRKKNVDLEKKPTEPETFNSINAQEQEYNRINQENGFDQVDYIDDNVNSIQLSEVDLGLPEDNFDEEFHTEIGTGKKIQHEFTRPSDLHAIHEYANDEVIQYSEQMPIDSQTLPMPPKRKKKLGKNENFRHSSLKDFHSVTSDKLWEESQPQMDDIIVYRTEHEYIVPQNESINTEQSPVPPQRNRSRSSRGTSFCDDDRTSHGAESLTLDTQIVPGEDDKSEIRHESPGYATVDKGSIVPKKGLRRSLSKTPPVRHRKSNSSERKYYTVGSSRSSIPSRPARKKSSTSLITLDSLTKRSISGDITQYVEIDDPPFEEVHKNLESGEVVSKMKDRPLPPPPRPPRGSRSKKTIQKENLEPTRVDQDIRDKFFADDVLAQSENNVGTEDVVEIEVSTQTDPLPDDIDFELDMENNFDVSMNSLRDLVDDESFSKSLTKLAETNRTSRPSSRSEKSTKYSDPKIAELSKSSIGRTSPTVILVERRVSSPTRINEREEMLTEASLTVQHIDVDESKVPELPPLPRSRGVSTAITSSKNIVPPSDERALERVSDASRDIQLENLITQRLQVSDLDVGRLNVSEIQASKILVSDIQGMTLQVSELDSKSGHISVSGVEFSQSVIDEIVKKFAEISTSTMTTLQVQDTNESQRPQSREEQTQTEVSEAKESTTVDGELEKDLSAQCIPLPAAPDADISTPPQRPPPPDFTPLLYTYLQDLSVPPTFCPPRPLREKSCTEIQDSHRQTPPPPTRRAKRRHAVPISESSSDDGRPRPSPRRMQPAVRAHEPTITEAGAQFLRVCQNSITRTVRNIFSSFMSYLSGTEDKKDAQMALVIFLVLIAGLIMFGLSDSRTIHHHHWEFFNPPDGKQ